MNIVEWRTANPEKQRESRAKWAAANPEKDRANRARWQAANSENQRAKRAEREATNPEKYRAARAASRAKWRAANPEKNRKAAKRWAAANPEKRRIIERRWEAANPHSHARKVSGNWRRYCASLLNVKNRRVLLTTDQLMGLLEQQGYKCALTGVDMTCIRGRGKVPTNASIDRIEAGGLYAINNIQLVCAAINIWRGTSPVSEFIAWCRLVVERSDQALAIQSGMPIGPTVDPTRGAVFR